MALTALKVMGAAVGFVWGWNAPAEVTQDGGTVLSAGVLFLIMLAFAAVGLFLLTSGYGDDRAWDLGAFFLLLATPFANRPLLALAQGAPVAWAWPALILYTIASDAFLAFYLWSFTQKFPNSVSSFRVQRLLFWGGRAGLVAGFAGFIWQIARLVPQITRLGLAATPAELVPPKPSYEYYGPLLLLTIPAFVMLLWRARGATGEEGRRARLFVAALVAGIAPLFLDIIAESVIPAYKVYSNEGGHRELLSRLLLFPCLLTVPFTTTYAVVVGHLLDVKLIARRALQYALARYSAIGLALVPVAAILLYLYKHQEEKLVDILSGPHLLLLASSFAVAVAALRYRRTLLDAIDRHFFREQYDARQTLTLLVERIRATHGVLDLANLLCREADLALHPESVALMAFEPRSGLLADPKVRGRRLDASSSLASLVASASEPLTVDLEDPRSPLAKLPEKDRHWLVDSGFRLVAPILARDGSLLGLIGLGQKKSGLPFFKEDRQLLRAIGSSAAWVLELEQNRSTGSSHRSWQDPVNPDTPLPFPEPGAAAAELAKECPNCGRLYASYTVFCSHCSRRLEASHVPYVLPAKFRFEKRIGTGGMGVVYRGTDLALGRPVAVKTLRRVSPEDAMRLRREARTAAAVSHPHLAPVYGMETWQGTPILVMELLEGGTLAQRIEKGRLEAAETVELGIAMAEALQHLHASDILHRDIKPSNIGYTRDGVPKLMDFGIARVMFDLRRDTEVPSPDAPEDDSALPPTSIWHHTPTSATASKQLVGTLSYLSPEALIGQPADTSFDLWGLAIVLYECLLGRKIFSGGDMHQLMNRIRHGRVPEFAQVLPEHEALLGDFFRSALHRTITRRPASARELRERLAAVRLRLAA
jgi:eukaryotic-like serine/threonine-protein kinase